MNNQERRAVQWLSNEIKQIPNIIFKKIFKNLLH